MEQDEVLYAHYLSGDGAAFQELVERYKNSLTLFLYGMLHDMDDAEELMLDTFAVLITSRKCFEGRSSFKTWLFAIGRNLACKRLRRQQLFRHSIDDLAQGAGAPSPEVGFLCKKQKRALYDAMQTLKEEYRQVLFLLYFEDASYAQAARIMRKSEKQISNLAYHSRQALRARLDAAAFDF